MAIRNLFPEIKPSLNLDFANTKQLDPRITFSRATSGTYYDGKTFAKAEENLFSYSQEFDNAYWTKSSSSIAPNTTVAPDGTSTADSWVKTSGTNTPQLQVAVTPPSGSVPITRSIYAKYVDQQWVRVAQYRSDGTLKQAWFDVQNGVVGVVSSNVGASIVPVGNGWYRLIFVLDSVIGTNQPAYMYMASGDNNTDALAGSGSIYIWGAQFEQRSAATVYTPTTSQPITNYIPVLLTAPAGVARFDHNTVTGESLGLLIEESRANLLSYSSDFGNAVWSKVNTTVVENYAIAPNGLVDADLVYPSISSSSVYGVRVSRIVSSLSSGQYVASYYIKSAGWRWVYLTDPSGSNHGWFDLFNGVPGSTGGNQGTIDLVGDGWYKVTITRASNTVAGYCYVNFADANGSSSCTPNATNGIYLWGAQLEAGSFATSYIPTTSAQVTRAADAAAITGTNFSSWYRQDEGTFFGDYLSGASAANIFISVNNNSGSNEIGLYSSPTGESVFCYVSGSSQTAMVLGARASGSAKRILTYAANNLAASSSGATAVTDSSAVMPLTRQINIGAEFNGTSVLNGRIKCLAYYPKRLTNAQLQALTA